MASFQKLLLAIDLSPSSDSLIQRVVQMYPDKLDRIHVVHVIKPVLGSDAERAGVEASDPDIQREMHTATQRVFRCLNAGGLSCATSKFHLLYGEPSFQIKRLARELGADLVVVGSHCKEDDWMHLPGTTTNCVIQGISSDVMAVKV